MRAGSRIRDRRGGSRPVGRLRGGADPIAALDALPPWQATVVVRAARRFVARTGTAFDGILVDELVPPVVFTLALCGVFV